MLRTQKGTVGPQSSRTSSGEPSRRWVSSWRLKQETSSQEAVEGQALFGPVRGVKRFLSWLALRHELTYPTALSQLTEHLQVRLQEPCNRAPSKDDITRWGSLSLWLESRPKTASLTVSCTTSCVRNFSWLLGQATQQSKRGFRVQGSGFSEGIDIVQCDHAPQAGVAQGIFHGDLIRHRDGHQVELEEELEEEVERRVRRDHSSNQTQVRMHG